MKTRLTIAAPCPGESMWCFCVGVGVVKIDLHPSSTDQSFKYRWIDLVDEKTTRKGTVNGGEIREFHPPEDYPGVEQYKDWVLHVVETAGEQ